MTKTSLKYVPEFSRDHRVLVVLWYLMQLVAMAPGYFTVGAGQVTEMESPGLFGVWDVFFFLWVAVEKRRGLVVCYERQKLLDC